MQIHLHLVLITEGQLHLKFSFFLHLEWEVQLSREYYQKVEQVLLLDIFEVNVWLLEVVLLRIVILVSSPQFLYSKNPCKFQPLKPQNCHRLLLQPANLATTSYHCDNKLNKKTNGSNNTNIVKNEFFVTMKQPYI